MSLFNQFVKKYRDYKQDGKVLELYLFLDNDLRRSNLERIFRLDKNLVGNIDSLFETLKREAIK